MEPNIFDKYQEVDLKQTMENAYIDYAMSVIASRALPDVRDGLKPVQRRILYSMNESNNTPDKPHRKSAHTVGNTMAKYHPHGDSSIYGALVNMAQNWSYRYTLVDGHGNFGSVDGDGAAAMRYTEARLSKVAVEMLTDIGKNTVDFVPNFDNTEKEPVVLPARLPNLLANGTTGIAVGMATNIPPHNLKELVDGINHIIDNRIDNKETDIEDILSCVSGPDFPTGATILGKKGIREAYTTGRGKIKMRAVSNIEVLNNSKSRIIVTELPYLVNKAKLIEKIAELVKDKKIDGIVDLRDETNRQGMRIVIELRKDVNANVILNRLYKHTQLQDTFGVNMLALVNNEPKVLNIKQVLEYYLDHQEDVVKRRTEYDLNITKERAHIIEGLLIALDNIDEIIKIIRSSDEISEAKNELIKRYDLSDRQAQAIVDMRLRSLTGLEKEKLQNEYNEKMEKIKYFESILADKKILLNVVKEEINLISSKYSDERKTKFVNDEEIDDEDLIPSEDTIVTITNLGYIKRMSIDTFKSQHRGGKGIKGMQTIDEDFVKDIITTNTHDNIYFFTNMGRLYTLKAYKIPDASRTSRGVALINLISLMPNEKVTAIISDINKSEKDYLFMATKKGIVKKTEFELFKNIRTNGLKAINLRDDDELIEVKITNGKDEIILVTEKGIGIKFKEEDIRPIGRNSMGVKGIKLDEDDSVIGMQISNNGKYLLTVSENGYGKRTELDKFRIQSRHGKGIICHKLNNKIGNLIGAKLVNEDDQILLITNEGIIIRLEVSNISIVGRNSMGVKLMNIDKDTDIKVASIAKIIEKEE